MKVIHNFTRFQKLFTLKRNRFEGVFPLKRNRFSAETEPRSIYTCIYLYKNPVVSNNNCGQL
jgi:hypothetical protein